MPLILFLLLLLPMQPTNAISQTKPRGFHWYSVEKPVKEPLTMKPKPAGLSPYEVLMARRRDTQNRLAKALLNPSFEATHDYMKAQQQYARNNQQFVRYWQQVLLAHPELDHSLLFPTDNSAIAIRNDETGRLLNKLLAQGAKEYGLILFYRGNQSISQKFVNILLPFVREHQFAMISVATDGQPIAGLPDPKVIPLEVVQKTLPLQARYLPALFLVHLKTKSMSPLSYGFVSVTELKERFLDVATQFKRFSYEGLGDS